MEWVCETPGESDKQVAEAVIPALKDKSIEVLFFLTFRTLMLNKICEFGWHHEQFVPDMM